MSALPTFKVVRYGPSVYFLGGELDLASAPVLTDAIAPSVEHGGAIVLDLAALTFIDSMGVHAIAAAGRTLGSNGCLIVHAPQPSVARVLDLVGLDAAPNIHVEGCGSDTLPDAFLDWSTPEDIAGEFEELRMLAQRGRP
jgi:anti-sigma B factor antagonist